MKGFHVHAVPDTAPKAGMVSISADVDPHDQFTAYALLTPTECRRLANDLWAAADVAGARGGAA